MRQREGDPLISNNSFGHQFDSMMRLSGLGRWMLDVSNNVMSFDQHLQYLLGWPAVSNHQLDFTEWCNGVHEHDIERVKAAWQQFLEGRTLNFGEEFRYRTASGSYLWILCRCEKVASGMQNAQLYISGTVQDIHERKRKELLLEHYHQRLTYTKEVAHIGSWEMDISSGAIILSPIALKTTGIGYDLEPNTHEILANILIDHHRHLIIRSIARLRTSGGAFDQEIAVQTNEGQLRWLRVVGTAALDEEGEAKIYGLVQDVHDQVSVREKLAEQEELFRNVFAYSGNGIALVSIDGQWLKVNPAFCVFLGYTEKELKRRNLSELVFAEDAHLDAPLILETLANKRNGYQVEKRYRNKKGKIVWALLTVSIIRDKNGSPVHFIWQIADITERKFLNEELERSSAWLKAFFNSSRSNHIILDDHYRVVFFNDTVDRNALSLRSERIRVGMDVRKLISSSIRQKFERNYLLALEGELQDVQEKIYYAKLDQTFHWHMLFDPIKNDAGQMIGVSYVATDISATIENEAKLIRQDSSLKTIAFLQSHEMRRPVASILGLINVFRLSNFKVEADDFVMLENAFAEFDEKIKQIVEQVNLSMN